MLFRTSRPGLTVAGIVAATSLGIASPAGSLATQGPGHGSGDAGCRSPYRPISSTYRAPSSSVVEQRVAGAPAVVPELSDSSLLMRNGLDRETDMDGDGSADRIGATDDARPIASIVRGDGTVTVELPPLERSSPMVKGVGDLDADGRDELFVGMPWYGPGRKSRYFVLPGTTEPGVHAVEDIAIEVRFGHFQPAGDMIDGPGDDLVVTLAGTDRVPSHPGEFRSENYTGIISGDELMATDAGSTATVEISGGLRMDGELLGLYDLDDGDPAILTLTYANADGEGGGILNLHRNGRTRQFSSGWIEPRTVLIARYEDRLLMGGGNSSRSGTTENLWDIDDPCRPLAAGPQPDGADAARPRSGLASYTG